MSELRHRCRGPVGTPWDCPACDAEQDRVEWEQVHDFDERAEARASLEDDRRVAAEWNENDSF